MKPNSKPITAEILAHLQSHGAITEFVSKMSKTQKKAFLNTPDAWHAVMKMGTMIPQAQKQLHDTLVHHAIQSSMPTPTQIPQPRSKAK